MRKGKTYDYSYLQMIKFSKHTKNADLINSFNKVTVFFKKHSFFYILIMNMMLRKKSGK